VSALMKISAQKKIVKKKTVKKAAKKSAMCKVKKN